MRESGYQTTDVTSAIVGGMQAVLGTYEGNASGIGTVMARGGHVILSPSTTLRAGRTFFIGGIAPPDLYSRVAGGYQTEDCGRRIVTTTISPNWDLGFGIRD